MSFGSASASSPPYPWNPPEEDLETIVSLDEQTSCCCGSIQETISMASWEQSNGMKPYVGSLSMGSTTAGICTRMSSPHSFQCSHCDADPRHHGSDTVPLQDTTSQLITMVQHTNAMLHPDAVLPSHNATMSRHGLDSEPRMQGGSLAAYGNPPDVDLNIEMSEPVLVLDLNVPWYQEDHISNHRDMTPDQLRATLSGEAPEAGQRPEGHAECRLKLKASEVLSASAAGLRTLATGKDCTYPDAAAEAIPTGWEPLIPSPSRQDQPRAMEKEQASNTAALSKRSRPASSDQPALKLMPPLRGGRSMAPRSAWAKQLLQDHSGADCVVKGGRKRRVKSQGTVAEDVGMAQSSRRIGKNAPRRRWRSETDVGASSVSEGESKGNEKATTAIQAKREDMHNMDTYDGVGEHRSVASRSLEGSPCKLGNRFYAITLEDLQMAAKGLSDAHTSGGCKQGERDVPAGRKIQKGVMVFGATIG